MQMYDEHRPELSEVFKSLLEMIKYIISRNVAFRPMLGLRAKLSGRHRP